MEQEYESSRGIEIEGATRRPMWFHTGKRYRNFAGVLQKVLVLQGKPQERIGALAFQLKFAAHAGAVVFDGSVVDGKLGADFFAGFALGDQAHNTELGRGEIACQGIVCLGSI